jgi:hypothetical protein
LQQDKTTTCGVAPTTVTYPDRQSGLQATYLEWEAANGQRRARYALLNMKNANNKDFYAYFPGELLYQAVEPGGHMSSPMSIEDESGSLLNVTDSNLSYKWFAANGSYGAISGCDATDTCKGVTVDIKKKAGSYSFEVDVDADETIAVPGEYYVRIQVDKDGFRKWAWYYIKVNPPLSNASSLSKYVYVLGYARFRITKITSNYIEGEAVSGLLTTDDEIKYGLTPRLQPW